jgi:hypothetical protein
MQLACPRLGLATSLTPWCNWSMSGLCRPRGGGSWGQKPPAGGQLIELVGSLHEKWQTTAAPSGRLADQLVSSRAGSNFRRGAGQHPEYSATLYVSSGGTASRRSLVSQEQEPKLGRRYMSACSSLRTCLPVCNSGCQQSAPVTAPSSSFIRSVP